MKKQKDYTFHLLLIILGIAVLSSLTCCTTVKKDCRGVKHYKHQNGFYI